MHEGHARTRVVAWLAALWRASRMIVGRRARSPRRASVLAWGLAGLAVSSAIAQAPPPGAVSDAPISLERDGRSVDPDTDALSVSRQVPNDDTLPRAPDARSARDPEAFRIVAIGDATRARLSRVEPNTGVELDAIELALDVRDGVGRSAFVRLVADPRDAAAPGVASRVLRVGLGDVVEVSAAGSTRRWRVGRPSEERGPRAHRRARVRVHVVRENGVPAVGGDDEGARLVMRDQLALANAIFAPCHVDLGSASAVEVNLVDPPPPTSIAIADGDGLPALGGEVRFRIGDRAIRVAIPTGSSPENTAERVAAALHRARFAARVVVEPRNRNAAGPSASVHVRDANGAFVTLAPDDDQPLSTDRRQTVRLGAVELGDGLDPFEDGNARAGTLEERALLHALVDDDPHTIDVVVVPRFARPERQGEAFIASDEGPLRNVVVIDRRGLARARTAYTLPHELAHVLLDVPFHPDELGEPDPTRLMSSRASDATVLGPKRLTAEECARLRFRGEHNGLLHAP
ncbi:MAG: hypothetical protein MUE69_25275 [Myxococcota bacterium]|jgi:hypothetical protein|nr:hypothetical protein [Myxococcota bacterium]